MKISTLRVNIVMASRDCNADAHTLIDRINQAIVDIANPDEMVEVVSFNVDTMIEVLDESQPLPFAGLQRVFHLPQGDGADGPFDDEVLF